VLHSDVFPQRGVKRIRDIASSEHVAGAGAQVFVDRDPVVHREARGLGKLRVRRDADADADADNDRIGINLGAVVEPYPGCSSVRADDLCDRDTEPQVNAALSMQSREDLGAFASKHPQQRQLRPLQHRHGSTRRTRSFRGFQADPAGTDDRDSRPCLQRNPEKVSIVNPTQIQDPLELGTWHR
jgi:hypothetical protein